jgi:hypoxanthine phosphoribosyltransferase
MQPSSRQTLISGDQIAARVRVLGGAITRHYAGRVPVFLGVMNGALFFMTDLVRSVDLDTEISCVRLASYSGTASTGRVSGLDGLEDSVRGREVLIIDDILDTGRTLATLSSRLQELGAADVKICVLLEKKREHVASLKPDWVGFPIEDAFVVGYGLDYNGRYRSLPGIEVLPAPEKIASTADESQSMALNAAR